MKLHRVFESWLQVPFLPPQHDGICPYDYISLLHFWHTESNQSAGYLESGLHGDEGGAAERASASLVSTAVGLTDAEEDHAGRQTGRQSQRAFRAEVCGTARETERSLINVTKLLSCSRTNGFLLGLKGNLAHKNTACKRKRKKTRNH